MEILVCVKRVPDTAENEIEINSDGSDINRDDLVYSINEWDNYAVEEAVSIREKLGGKVTVVTIGDDDSEEVLRREMAMGADNGILISDKKFMDFDGRGLSSILKSVVDMGKYDLILTGAMADGGSAQTGGMLAAMLDLPYASLVNSINIIDDSKIRVGREIEGGNQEINEIQLPCVLSIQTGINEPRYVGIRGIRKVASIDIPRYNLSDLGVDLFGIDSDIPIVKKVNYFVPEIGDGAEMLEGSSEEIISSLINLLRAKGGLK